MKKTVTNDFLYYTGEDKAFPDFNGEDISQCIPLEQRMEYLKKYAEFSKDWYDDKYLNTYAASEEEVKYLLGTYALPETRIRKSVHFDEMLASKCKVDSGFKNIYTYCGARIVNDEFIFDKDSRPGPAAKIDLPQACSELHFSCEVYVDSAYQNSTGSNRRIIELRNKTLDEVKITFSSGGIVSVIHGDRWVPKTTEIGRYAFDRYNTLAIYVGDTVCVKLNDKVVDVGYCPKQSVDNIFLEAGMLPHSVWKVKDIEINQEPLQFIKSTENRSELIGKVKLPYAIGTYENRDKALFLEGDFWHQAADKVYLVMDSLDPCGKAWVNGQVVLHTDRFTRNKVDITDYIQDGINHLKIMVAPRPGEVFYSWHRHTDCYNGWFCGDVRIEFCAEVSISSMVIKTISINREKHVTGKVSVALNKPVNGKLSFWLAKSYPRQGDEVLLGSMVLNGKDAEFFFDGEFDLWSPEAPVLYVVRTELSDESGNLIDDFADETSFRRIVQKKGALYLNNKRTVLRGALMMQFLPPFDMIPVNHNCPTDEQIAWQIMMLKNMNGNFMRLHMLGYGSNDRRYARYCDRAGIMLVWVTRYIDTLESLVWEGDWKEKELYLAQIKEVLNHPSIIMWEGSNEFHPKTHQIIDKMYDAFVSAVVAVDDTRLLSPCSHLYYAGGLYDMGCVYYNDDGTEDECGNKVQSGFGWTDSKVVRSCHPYSLFCGYGASWEDMRKQPWKSHKELFESKEHAYLCTEYAVTGLANPNTKEALENTYYESYERGCEDSYINRHFYYSEWQESQALQALCAFNGTKYMRQLGADGMSWCCLSSGANNGSYMKPPIDFWGYCKLGFYALRSAFEKTFAAKKDIRVTYGNLDEMEIVVVNAGNQGKVVVTVEVLNEKKVVCDKHIFSDVELREEEHCVSVGTIKPVFEGKGYYTIRCTVEDRLTEGVV